MKIAIGSDHGGYELKEAVKAALSQDKAVIDKGTFSKDSCDYPDYAQAVALAVAKGEADFGILCCTSGIGVSMAAGRFQNVRAAVCRTVD